MWESHIPDWRKPASKVAGKRQNSQPESAKLYIEVEYKYYEYTTTTNGVPVKRVQMHGLILVVVVVVNCSESSTREEAVLRQEEKADYEFCRRG